MSIVIIDPQIENHQDLLAHLIDDMIDSANVFVLDADREGVPQITELLRQSAGIARVHLISHGSPGCLYLGNSQLSLATIERYRSLLETWFAPTVRSPALLLYGCQVAAGESGTQLIKRLHQLTGASIAASTTLTGHATQGGNWQLDAKIGSIETSFALRADLMAFYPSVLANTLGAASTLGAAKTYRIPALTHRG